MKGLIKYGLAGARVFATAMSAMALAGLQRPFG